MLDWVLFREFAEVCYITTKLREKLFTLNFQLQKMSEQHTDIQKVFGENLRSCRRQKGLSQRALDAICGIDHGMISRMENGEVNVTLKTVATLAEALGVPFWILIQPDGYLNWKDQIINHE